MKRIKLVVAIVCIQLLICSVTSKGWAKDNLTLLLDWFVNPDHAPIIIALEKGYLEKCDKNVKRATFIGNLFHCDVDNCRNKGALGCVCFWDMFLCLRGNSSRMG